MSNKQTRLNCYSDLCKAATAFYLNPVGTTHIVFLRHAQEILKKNFAREYRDYYLRLRRLEKETDNFTSNKQTDITRKADEIHTLGILLKFS